MPDTRRIARVTPGTLCREVQGETVLLHLESGEYFGLDEVATRIWQLILEKGDLAEVEAAMQAEYEADAAVLAADLNRVVGELAAKRLIAIDTVPLAGR
jgi:hypothetical protein